ncbi:MAG TPA: GrpB family protein [Pseudonocardiaceae bacterium]|jgi:GrpB-like predicted nucleotidyltransferase (UPF0157 family)|nr:GrpB family protein [Pseudonocardiaceae bacterium]
MTSQPITTEVRVVAADPAWPSRAEALLTEIVEVLGPAVVHADHIGSTAIPGMAAKDVLDLQLSVLDLPIAQTDFDAGLAGLGFVLRPFNHDHVPAGSSDSPANWGKRAWARRGHPGGDVNLHVRLVGSPNERLALLFRDWFRAHPESVPGYAEFKRVLAGVCPDLGGYTEVKDPVVDLVIGIAEGWAERTGWQPHADSSHH